MKEFARHEQIPSWARLSIQKEERGFTKNYFAAS
jgi:hypothetical protein